MPGKSKESGQKVKARTDLRRKPLRWEENKNLDSELDEAVASEEDSDVNEDVDSSEEPIQTSHSQTGRLSKDKKSKDEAPQRLYPEIPVLDVPKHEDSASSGTSIHALWHISWPILIFIGYFLTRKFLQPSPEPSSFVPPFDVDAVVSTLRQDFSFLPEKNFRVLKAALRGVNTDSEPRAPAILLLVSPKGQESTSSKFSTHLAKILDENYVLLSGTELSKNVNSKKHIDDTIRTSIEERRAKVFLVSELQKLDFDTTLIFHSFCDDQNAPYKRVVYVITVSCQLLNTSMQWDKIAMDCLSQAWPDIHSDMKDPLVNRLTPSVMILH